MLSPSRYPVRICQMALVPGDIRGNTHHILLAIDQARREGIRLVIFPELAVSGLLRAEEWLNTTLARSNEESIEQIIAAAEEIAIIFGAVVHTSSRARINVVIAAEQGKRLSPTGSSAPYLPIPLSSADRFGCAAGFTPVTEPSSKTFSFADGALKVQVDDTQPPQDAETLVLSLSTRPYVRNAPQTQDLVSRAKALNAPVLTCSAAGVVDMGKTLFVLEGASSCAYPDGTTVRAAFFSEAVLDLHLHQATLQSPCAGASPEMVIRAMEAACAFQLKRLGISSLVIGASGGIDSALTAALYSRVIGPENLLLVNMPSRHNSDTTITLARQLAERLGTYYVEVPIEASVAATREQIDSRVCTRPGQPIKHLTLTDAALENVQARDRSGRVLAALASATGGVFTCNVNKSEATIGYGTLYGDIAGFFGALADLWKTEIWELARCYNETFFHAELIPQGSIDLMPSAELSPEQNVDDGKGDPLIYPWHDRLFAAWTEREIPATLDELYSWYLQGTLATETGFQGDILKHFPDTQRFRADCEHHWKLYNGLARAKRLQAPPVLSLKNRTYGFDLGGAQLPIIL